MDGLSKTDEVLALLNKRERGEGPKPPPSAASDENLTFTDFLPSPAAAVLYKLQRISAQPRSDQPKPVIHTINRTPSDALKVVLGEQRPEPRKLRRSTASFRRKLFGHEQQAGFEDNIISQDQSMHNVRVHPLSAFKRYWDLAIVVMVAYTVVVLPVRCAFSWDYYHALDAGHNIFHQLASLVMGRNLVAQNYLRGWFTLDLVSSFPIDLVLFGKRSDLWRLPRLLKVIRVLHNKTLAKAAHDIKRLKILSDISQFDAQILKLTTYVFLWIHWNACLQYGSCVAQPDSSMCWVQYNHLQGSPVFDKYSWSALKALSEMVTAGYGTQEPETMIDVWVTMFSLLMGTTMWLILGSIITTLLIHLNAAHSEYTAKMTALSQYMTENNLPQASGSILQELRQRIRDSYEARWKAEKHFDEDLILNEMPGSLRIEVCMHTCADLIASVPFLEDAEDDFVRYLVTQLHPTVYLRNDMIIRAGELGREMFFIKAGAVQVELDGKPITLLKKGSYFGELSLLRDIRRTASVRVVSETCDLFVLTKAGPAATDVATSSAQTRRLRAM
ncbi:TPA: SCF ubiquitin ligase complex subunit [Trebouxia sp. C0004]